MKNLRDQLLKFGGKDVTIVIPDDRDAIVEQGTFNEAVLERGQFFDGGENVIRMPDGELSACPSEEAKEIEKNMDKGKWCAGYALSEDGVWCQHSWFLFPVKDDWRVVEFTTPCAAYFGVILTDEESDKFDELIQREKNNK